MSLFKLGDFTLHSGASTFWKVDCDCLTDDDWTTLARMIYEENKPFRKVIGIPSGGLKLAKALQIYCFPNPEYPILIVDDVLTTGKSMEEARAGRNVKGAVVFARGAYPDWIKPLWLRR